MSQSETDEPRPTWEVFCGTVRGAAHFRSGVPNQDAFQCERLNGGTATTIILAVADGHGGRKSFRSEQGAHFAVDVATKLLQEFRERLGSANFSEVEHRAKMELTKMIVREWQQRVQGHLQVNPLTGTDWDRLKPAEGKAADDDYFLIYGSTLLAVLLTPKYLLFLQLGDGDILCVADDGHTSRPMPSDERLFANETVSLCSHGPAAGKHRPSAGPVGSWSEFRVRLQPLQQGLPALILLSTDGYANAFRTEDDFVKVGGDILGLMRRKGADFVQHELEGWLSEASATGSGDDVTLGLIYRLDALRHDPSAPAPKTAVAEPVMVSESGEAEAETATTPQATADDVATNRPQPPAVE